MADNSVSSSKFSVAGAVQMCQAGNADVKDLNKSATQIKLGPIHLPRFWGPNKETQKNADDLQQAMIALEAQMGKLAQTMSQPLNQQQG